MFSVSRIVSIQLPPNFFIPTQSFLYLSCRIQDDAEGTPTLPFIQYDNCPGAVQVYDQVGEHVF